jgi:hypothetical protein
MILLSKVYWKILPKSKREALLSRMSVVDRSAIDKILSDNISLPPDFLNLSCIFIHVPKCAGTSIKNSLFRHKTHGHMPLWWYEQNFPDFFNSAFKFAFVRDPLERAYSAYSYLRSNQKVARDQAAREMILRFNDFDSFVRNWLCEENVTKQIHFAPQWQFLCDSLGQVRMDFIGRQESITTDFSYICTRLGIESSLQQHNVSPKQQESGPSFHHTTVDKVHRIYERDYELLGY